MEFATLKELRPEIQAYIPFAPNPTLDRALRRAAIQFCERSLAARETLDPLTLVGTIEAYELDLPPQTKLVEIIEARYDKSTLAISSERELSIDMPEWKTAHNTPKRIYRKQGNFVGFAPAPAKTEAVAVDLTVAVAPTRNATQIPEILAETYLDALVAGALSLLYAMPGLEWSNPREAQSASLMFFAGIRVAQGEANRNSTRRRKTVRYGGI